MILHPRNFRALFFERGWGGGGQCIPVWELNCCIKFFPNPLIALSWESPTRKGDSGTGVCKAFYRSAAARMDKYLERKLGIFINSGTKDIVSSLVSLPVSVLYPV